MKLENGVFEYDINYRKFRGKEPVKFSISKASIIMYYSDGTKDTIAEVKGYHEACDFLNIDIEKLNFSIPKIVLGATLEINEE